MGMSVRPSRALFAAAMIGLGINALIYGNWSLTWVEIPKAFPGRAAIIYVCGVIALATGIGLLLRTSVTFACRVLLPCMLLWLAFLKLPGVVRHPLQEVRWESFGETAVLTAGAWCLFAAHAGIWERRHLRFAVGESGIRAARLLLIAALPMFGLSHFAYLDNTATLVPKWLGSPVGWAYLTGSASLAAAAGMLFGIYPRLAANLEAAMLWIFTLLVWVPKVAPMPGDEEIWSEFLLSGAIAAGTWLVADTYRSAPWRATGKAARAISFDSNESIGPH